MQNNINLRKNAEKKVWQKFEEAVAIFVAALDPNAVVRHNYKTPDIDTGEPRQRDVWVETNILNSYPIKILISCKKLAKKVNQQDMDAFIGELRSSGAHKGIIYSYSGFTKPAVKKALNIGICCCTLYENKPPEIPEILLFQSYCCTSQFNIVFSKIPQKHINITICALCSILIKSIKHCIKNNQFPVQWEQKFKLPGIFDEDDFELGIRLKGNWKIFKGILKGHLLQGSYSFTEKKFLGIQCSPYVNMKKSSPGPGWKEIVNTSIEVEPNSMIFFLFGEIDQDAINILGPKQINN